MTMKFQSSIPILRWRWGIVFYHILPFFKIREVEPYRGIRSFVEDRALIVTLDLEEAKNNKGGIFLD